jgi:hypothetical protein
MTDTVISQNIDLSSWDTHTHKCLGLNYGYHGKQALQAGFIVSKKFLLSLLIVFCLRTEVRFSVDQYASLVMRVAQCARDSPVDTKLQDNGISALDFPYQMATLTHMV